MKVRRIDFYPDDWIAGTIGLTHDERSVLISICAAIWSRGGPVEEAYVRQICGPGQVSRKHFERGLAGLLAKGKVSKIGTESGQFLDNFRAESELNRAKIRTELGQKNGAKGGRPNGLAKPDGFENQKPNIQQPAINNQQEGVAVATPRARPRPPLLAEWQPSDKHRQLAYDEGRDDAWVDREAERYRDQQPNAKVKHKDFDAGFRNWIRNAPDFERHGTASNGHAKQSSGTKLFAGAADVEWELERRREERNRRESSATIVPLLDS